MSAFRLLSLSLVALFIQSCAAMFVPATKDPNQKLNSAVDLFQNQGRPLPAERLIREALQAFEKEGDPVGLADAYATYGLFFKSPAVYDQADYYRKNRFLDETATFDNRYDKAFEYWKKAENIYLEQTRHDRLTDLYLNMGIMFQFMKKQEAACSAFENSLKNYHAHIAEKPGAKALLPDDLRNYDEVIAAYKQESNCQT